VIIEHYLTTPCTKGQRLYRSCAFCVIFGLLITGAWCNEELGHPALLFGASFERHPVLRFLPGSRKTILFPAYVNGRGDCTPVGSQGIPNPRSWDAFLKESGERTSLLLATIDPKLVSDQRGVIQMALIVSDNPMTASCILAPGFLQRFSTIFGPELLIVIPAKNRIYVFPKLANRMTTMTDTIRDDYKISPMPVSTEVFELTRRGLKTVGTLEASDE
jgi:hypothetical protein